MGGFSDSAIKEMQKPPPPVGFDETMLMHNTYSHGFLRPFPDFFFGSTDYAFGSNGTGGSFGFADAEAGIAYGYVMRLGNMFYMDPRELSLRQAVYEVVGDLGGPTR